MAILSYEVILRRCNGNCGNNSYNNMSSSNSSITLVVVVVAIVVVVVAAAAAAAVTFLQLCRPFYSVATASSCRIINGKSFLSV